MGTHGHAMWSTFLTLPVVPITLTEFKGSLQNNHALLQWTTSMEINSKHFELEKSFDGSSYRKIATIPAAHISSTAKQYSFTDQEKLFENNYYRLRSVDMDEKNNLSNTVLIKPQGIEQEMIVLYNPFKNNISIRFVKATEAPGILRLTDISGRLVAIQKIASGSQQIEFILPAGIQSRGGYQLQAIINGKKFNNRVLKE